MKTCEGNRRFRQPGNSDPPGSFICVLRPTGPNAPWESWTDANLPASPSYPRHRTGLAGV